jgi:hypothetical protein
MSVSGLTTATKSFQVELKAVSDNPENLTLGDNSWVSPVITTTGEAKFELSAGYISVIPSLSLSYSVVSFE